MALRGQLTPPVKAFAESKGFSDFNRTELRLLPYIQYVMMNEQKLELSRINSEEREAFSRWREKGWVTGGAGPMTITKQFWDSMNQILWLSYVNHEEEQAAIAAATEGK